jgi:hypothetical protein
MRRRRARLPRLGYISVFRNHTDRAAALHDGSQSPLTELFRGVDQLPVLRIVGDYVLVFRNHTDRAARSHEGSQSTPFRGLEGTTI